MWFSNGRWWPRWIKTSEGDRDERDREKVASDNGPMELMKDLVVRGSWSGEDPSNMTGD